MPAKEMSNFKELIFEKEHYDGYLISRILIWKNIIKPAKSGADIPIWGIVVTSLGYTALITILIASYVIVYTAPRPSQYLESCYKKSCVNGLNLKCINNTCQCKEHQYYNLGCVDQQSYLGKCALAYQCLADTKLICNEGMCKCEDTFYWNGVDCFARKNYNQTCNGDQCLSINMIFCNMTSTKCECDADR